MTAYRKIRSFGRSLFTRRRVDREMTDELEFHVASRVEDLVKAGMSRQEADTRARRELGDVRVWQEDARGARGFRLVDDVRADVRYGVRWLPTLPHICAVGRAVDWCGGRGHDRHVQPRERASSQAAAS